MINPEINEMQVRAIFEASLALLAEGKTPLPSIEIPLVGNFKECVPCRLFPAPCCMTLRV